MILKTIMVTKIPRILVERFVKVHLKDDDIIVIELVIISEYDFGKISVEIVDY